MDKITCDLCGQLTHERCLIRVELPITNKSVFICRFCYGEYTEEELAEKFQEKEKD